MSSISPVLVGYIDDTVGLWSAFALLAVATLVSAGPIVLLFSDRVWLPVDEVRASQPVPGKDD